MFLFVLLSDRVFGPTCLTETVYQEGAKEVALSALTGINGNNKSMISSLNYNLYV